MASPLSQDELIRYARHLAIPEFGMEGQQKLKAAKVLVIGAGGLGSPVLLYLAAAGVGHIGIVDFDVVDKTNLQRQVLYNENDVDKSKAATAKAKILALNPHIEVTVYNTAFSSANAMELIEQYDVVADGTDNFPTRYLVNDACVMTGKVNVYASIFRFEGQVSVFNYLKSNGERGPNYRDIFPAPPPPGLVPSCAEGGVLGVLPGIVGSLQASEVIKVITGIGEPLVGRLFLFDAAAFSSRILKFKKNPNNIITELIDYDEFCGILPNDIVSTSVNEITPQELKQLIDHKTDFQLIDVREAYEYDIANLNGELIPLDTIEESIDKISRVKQVVLHCRSGKRSAKAIETLKQHYPFDNLYNLKGGILAYADEVDKSLKKY